MENFQYLAVMATVITKKHRGSRVSSFFAYENFRKKEKNVYVCLCV